MGAFTPAIWSTIVWTEKFSNGLCTHFLPLHGLKSSRNSSCLKNRRCELSLRVKCYSAPRKTESHFTLKPHFLHHSPQTELGFIPPPPKAELLFAIKRNAVMRKTAEYREVTLVTW